MRLCESCQPQQIGLRNLSRHVGVLAGMLHRGSFQLLRYGAIKFHEQFSLLAYKHYLLVLELLRALVSIRRRLPQQFIQLPRVRRFIIETHPQLCELSFRFRRRQVTVSRS